MGNGIPLLNGVALEWVEENYYGETNGLFSTLRYAAAAIGTAAVFVLLTVTSGVEAYYDHSWFLPCGYNFWCVGHVDQDWESFLDERRIALIAI